MSSDRFTFKQFEIIQRESAMKVGTDGVLLGSWTETSQQELHVLDIGSGTGLLALMMAQRCPLAQIDAVEIEPGAAAESNFNFAKSPWKDRLKIQEMSFQEFAVYKSMSGLQYDLIISNPPYFLDSPTSETKARTAARHAALLPYDDLIGGVVALLEPKGGRFAAIFPYQEAGIFIAKAALSGLYCHRKLVIYPLSNRPAKRIAAEFSLTRQPITEESIVIVENQIDGYSQKYKTLTQDFYTKY